MQNLTHAWADSVSPPKRRKQPGTIDGVLMADTVFTQVCKFGRINP